MVDNPIKRYLFFSEEKEERIGELFKKLGILTDEQIDTILKEQKTSGKRFGEIALNLNFITEKDIVTALCAQTGYRRIDLEKEKIDYDVATQVNAETAYEMKVLPLRREDGRVIVAVADPFDINALNYVKSIFEGENVEIVIAEFTSLILIQQKVYKELSFDKRIDLLSSELTDTLKREGVGAQTAGIPRLVNYLILKGLADQASDIHLVLDDEAFRVFYRVRGHLIHFRTFDKILYEPVATQIKQAAGMIIGDKLHIEDGSLTVTIQGTKKVYLRVSKIPTVPPQRGESLVLRILDRTRVAMKLDNLGFYPEDLELLKRAVKHPYGMILVTGPTGSGKTTTLYSALLERNPFTTAIFTVEDPVEYNISGFRQVQVNPKAGVTFSSALKSFLRQDPDVILVGEIRDEETAKTALHAALTGHLVLSTVHTNTALETIPRLIELSINPSMIAESLIAIISQRLVRVVCPFCGQEREITEEERELFEKFAVDVPNTVVDPVFDNMKCTYCSGSGYYKQTVVYEILWLFYENVKRELLRSEFSIVRLGEAAKETGFKTLAQVALRKVADKITSMSEVKQKILRGIS